MLRILLIDDNPYDRILAIRELERAFTDLQITEVIQAEDFHRVLEAEEFDLVITDYQIRWTDGLTVLRTIKSRYPHLPVVMFTNSGSQEIAVEAMKSGLDDYVIKSPARYTRLPSAARLAVERAEAQRKATGLENRLQTLLDRLNVGVYRLTSEGVLLESNRAFLQLLGLDAPTEIASEQTLEPYFQACDYTQLINELMQEGEVRDREVEMRRADGVLIWVRISKTLTKVNHTTLIDGLIEDISDRKHIELENARLYQAAQEANQLKDEFLAIVSHELRTPLNALLGWAQILRRQNLDAATTSKALEVIERNAKRQSKLIEDILDISRIIRNQLHLNRQPLDLLPVIQAAIEDLQLSAEEKSIQIQTMLLPVGQVLGDAERLQQVVWNLLSNAIKFTPPGGQVAVKLERVENLELGSQPSDSPQTANFKPQTEFALITVSDTGQGIDADFLPHVFDRFRQADGSQTRAQGGLGLGLAIVRHLVEMHQGKVAVASAGTDAGSTFTVQLPLL